MGTGFEQVFCNDCLRNTRHRVLYEHSTGGDNGDGTSWATAYQIIECQGCGGATYRTDSTFSEWLDEDGDQHNYTYYPPQVSRKEPEWFHELPRAIKSIMSEVYIALHAGSRYLATVGARTVLDMLITDKIGDVGTFKQKIEKLESDGHITHPEAELIEAVTEAGHAAAHRGYAPDAKSLNHVMNILEAVLDKFYAAEGRQKKLAAQAAALKTKIPPRRP